MAFSVTCPECGSVLKSAAPIAAGKKVKCPKCGKAFASPPLEEATAVSSKPLPARSNDDDEAALAVPVEDDEPAPAPKRRPARAERAEREEPPSRKRKQREDEPEDDEDDEPRQKRKKSKKKSNNGMLVGMLVGGGLLLLLLCGGCGGLGFWFYGQQGPKDPPIVGRWEHVNHPLPVKPINTFDKNGQGSVQVAGLTISYRYRMAGKELIIEPSLPMGGALPPGVEVMERYTIAFNGDDEMVLTPINMQGRVAQAQQRYRRLK